MSKMRSRIPSPARSQPTTTPRRLRDRGSRSLGSPARSKPVRLSTLVKQFQDGQTESSVLSPVNRRSVLSDNTEIEEPRRQSWWKKLEDNSRDVMEVLPSNGPSDNVNDVEDLFEVLSQEPKIDSSHIPDSSGSESICSIVVPQRKLFTQKENKPRKTIGNFISSRDSVAKLQKSRVEGQDKTVIAGAKKLFGQASQRPKSVFPPGLLDMSTTKTVTDDERNETINTVPKKLFGHKDIQKPNSKYSAAVSASPEKATDSEPENAVKKNLFTRNQPRPIPAFPSALLELSQNKTGPNKTTKMAPPEVNVRNLFGNRPGRKRKNMFADLICSESEDEIPENQPRVFELQKGRGRSASRGYRDGSPTSSITTDIELDDWKMLPSSTMMMDNLDEIPGSTPMKRPRPSKLNKQKEQDTSSSSTANKTKQSEKSVSKNKSKISRNTSVAKNIEQEQVFEKVNSPNLTKNKSVVKNRTQDTEEVNKDKDIEIQQSKNKNSRKSIKESIDNDGNIALEYDDDGEVDELEIVDANQITMQEVNEVENKKQVNDDENINKNQSTKNINSKIHSIEKSQIILEEAMDKALDRSIEQNEVVVEQNEQEEENSVLQGDEEMVQSVLHDEEDDEIEEDDAEEDKQEMVIEEQVEENEEEEIEPSVLQDEEDNEMAEPTIEQEEVESEQDDEAANDEVEEIPEDMVESKHEIDEDPMEQTIIETENEDQDEAEQDQSEDNENVASEAEQTENSDDENDEKENDEEIVLTYEDDEGNNESVEASFEQDDKVEQEEDDHEEMEYETKDEEEDNENQESDQPEKTDETQETPDSTIEQAGETNVRSPEAILHDKTNWHDTFQSQGRNTSARRTKSMIQTNIRPSLVLAPMRDSVGSNTDSSSQGSGWDSHRVTRKTIRKTIGKDFTPRKSLRAMVMEKSAKRQTFANEVRESMKIPANSTEIANYTSVPDVYDAERNVTDREDTNKRDADQSDLDTSRDIGNNFLELLEKLKRDAIERNKKIAEQVRQSIRAPSRTLPNQYTYFLPSSPKRPPSRKVTKRTDKAKPRVRSAMLLGEVPKEVLEDMKYKPPKRFAPRNAAWATKRLYKFLEQKLEPKYDYKARVHAERLVEHIYRFAQDSRRQPVASGEAIAQLKHEMARLNVVKTHFEFYQFFHDFMPREVRVKVNPDVVNNLPLPIGGVYSNILHGESSRG